MPCLSQDLVIVDSGNHALRLVSGWSGNISTLAGNGTCGGLDNPVAGLGQLCFPSHVAVGPAGDLYIADTGNNRIRRLWQGSLQTLAGGLYGEVDGPVSSAQLTSPYGLAMAPDNSALMFTQQ